MKFSEQWLREWVNPPLDTTALAAQLTMAGLEVDAVEPVAAAFDGVVVGKVLEIDAHPEADRLQVCRVDAGDKQALTIVCGASNVHVGMLAPTACIGASLPGGIKIKKTRLRGVESHGMLCSAKELGLSDSADGLLSLPATLKPGQDVRVALQLDDVSIELGLTPNRGDCLSIAGIAREVGVLSRTAVTGPAIGECKATIADTIDIDIEADQACPRYLGRIIRNVDAQADTPLWMQEKLRRSGLRSISPVVDVTNYVLLELGQPMHAFDLATLHGGIHVRYARKKEQLMLLDGQQVTLQDGTLVIADDRQPLALAGIMGGQASAVSDTTTDLLLESAHFSPAAIAGKARDYGLHTDSSHRFERGVDADLPRLAMERATALLLDIAGGDAGPIAEACHEASLPVRHTVPLRAERLRRLLGLDIAAEEVADTLDRLGMQVETTPDGWQARAPGFRFDIAIEADLIEEVARIHGYDAIPSHRPHSAMRITPFAPDAGLLASLRQTLVARGYQEAITYSFVDAALQQQLEPDARAVRLSNPISAELAVMRTSLWPGLVTALAHNLNRQHDRVRFFENGVKFLPGKKGVDEVKVISGAACGFVEPEQWGSRSRHVDYFDIKNDVEVLLATAGGKGEYAFTADSHPALHPGQTARITNRQGTTIGWLGVLHPRHVRSLDLNSDPVVFELEIDALLSDSVVEFQELSRYPAIRRDLAIVVDETVAARDVENGVVESAGKLLSDLQLFDVYTGKGVESGRKSLAMGLTLQDFSRTLTDNEVEELIAGILSHLGKKFGATLRE